ncbi:GTP-binding protein [Aspergillus steynii IBT 23096]|uniref:GTP-binding protein n=1 Tax=Aspergillus steynii IBT 23096 TaxID=1392250 RepID=A0A2I2GCD1_9EURO|nr:GTP-binding protein [Aspergillus steynii IBT 23096]PLB50539.1 GTP-binding protein [Aspergillus steynii IBT 23096]
MTSTAEGFLNWHDSDTSQLNLLARQCQELECPPLNEIVPGLYPSAPADSSPKIVSLSSEEQEALFRSLQRILDSAAASTTEDEAHDEANGVEIQPSFQRVGTPFGEVNDILHKLSNCRSHYMEQAAEVLANGSRNPLWRLPFGQTGILDFFLERVASKENAESALLLHSLRLIGNCCADTDENRTIVVKGNYTAAILQHLLNPELIKVVLPVVYNLCMDFEPAQSQLAANKIVYIIIRLVRDEALKDNPSLLDFAYELIELTAEQEKGIEVCPDGTILLMMELLLRKEFTSTVAQFSCITNCLMSMLDNKRFQDICISRRMVSNILSVLTRAVALGKHASADDTQMLAQLQLKINQTLSEVSASSLFAETYPLDSDLTLLLKSWLSTTDDQLQICSCVMLGNLARSDEVCQLMVEEIKIHEELISILKGEARGAVLHSTLGFLKNLAIAGNNRLHLGTAGIIPVISRLWNYETVPQVQFAATSIARQLVISSVENITLLLETFSENHHNPPQQVTYLSLLLSLFKKTDSVPIKTEIGRLIASVCRTIVPKARAQDQLAKSVLERLFTMHEDVALPVGGMIVQSQWPVVRSEGWFALALMASNKQGSIAAIDCLQKMDLFPPLEELLGKDSSDEAEELQLSNDRDNAVVLVKELLQHDVSHYAYPTWWISC